MQFVKLHLTIDHFLPGNLFSTNGRRSISIGSFAPFLFYNTSIFRVDFAVYVTQICWGKKRIEF